MIFEQRADYRLLGALESGNISENSLSNEGEAADLKGSGSLVRQYVEKTDKLRQLQDDLRLLKTARQFRDEWQQKI